MKIEGKTIEEWLPIYEYEGIYSISSFGYIRRDINADGYEAGMILKNLVNGGYRSVVLWNNGKGKRHLCHSLVAQAFIGKRPEGFDINHKDGNKGNNHYSNLEYCTRQENVRHCVINRLQPRKLTEEKALEIRELYAKGTRVKDLSFMFNVDRSSVQDIIYRRSWIHV